MARFVNLRPQDLPNQVPSIELVDSQGRWRTIGSRGTVRSASGRYIYVQLERRIFVARVNRGIGHIDLSLGRPVVYAGEIGFGGRKKRGALRWWNNNSGHYRPDAFAAAAALLPPDLFRERTASP